MKSKLVIGEIYNGIEFLAVSGINSPGRDVVAKCHCGNVFQTRSRHVRVGHVTHCGCVKRGTHKLSTNPQYIRAYSSWEGMRQRCNNPNNANYHHYGGRGIKICPEWDDFSNFVRDMGICPPGYSIERLDVNGSYCKSNCVWILRNHQLRNTRRTVWISFLGEKLPAHLAAKAAGINPITFSTRRIREKAKNGKSPQEIFDEMRSELVH